MNNWLWLTTLLLTFAVSAQAGAVYGTTEVIELDNRFINCPDEPIYRGALELPTDGKAYQGMQSCGLTFHYAVEAPLTIGGDLTFSMFSSCEEPTAAGAPGALRTILAIFYINTESIGQTDDTETWTCTGNTNVKEFTGTIPVPATTVAPGDVLILDYKVFDNKNNLANQKPNLHVKVGPSFPSAFFLNGIPELGSGDEPAAPSEVVENVTDAKLEITHSWATPRNATHVFNWANNFSALDLKIESGAQNGSATITIQDSANETLYEATVEAPITLEDTFTGVATGDWTITVVYDAYVGDLALELGESAGASNGTADDDGAHGNETADEDSGNTTEDDAIDDDNDTPGIGIVMLLGLVAVAAVATRRRR